MDLNIIKDYILGTLTLEFIIAFYLFSLLGMFFTLLMHLSNKIAKNTRKNVNTKFSWGFWLKDNIIRVFANIISIFVLIRFYDMLSIKYELNMFLAFLAGSSIDLLVILIRKKTRVNIFQAKQVGD